MNPVVIVDAVRTPFGKRNGSLSEAHSVDLLSSVLDGLFARVEIEPREVEQVVGGCVIQIGMQALNVARNAWLASGFPISTGATTVDAQCGSSQQATNLAAGLIAAGVIDCAVSTGVEIMSRVPMGSSIPRDNGSGPFGVPITERYLSQHEKTTQFEGAERIADKWGFSRDDCDAFGVRSQERAARALDEDRFDSQLISIDGFARDEGPRPTSRESLGKLRPSGREDGVHTAGTSSQISDGASAVLLMSESKAQELGVQPIARIEYQCLVGSDPALMLTGPIDATRRVLERTGLTIDDIDVVEINEAFASVVMAWERELEPDPERVNPNGGAIALGHPLGATGGGLVAKAVHELHRSDGELALVTMCCGGGMGTGTLIRRV